MLVLTRRVGEELSFKLHPGCEGKNARVMIIGVEGNKVKVGIDAPREVEIEHDDVSDSTRKHV